MSDNGRFPGALLTETEQQNTHDEKTNRAMECWREVEHALNEHNCSLGIMMDRTQGYRLSIQVEALEG